jgi:dihydrofolate synthase/folylpolyglutamate synthase
MKDHKRTYEETVEFLYAQLPMFQHKGAAAFKKDLTNIVTLCEFLDHPEKRFRSVHIAGTNGKGSTSHILASLLGQAVDKVGLYTSPHFVDYRERIRIGNAMIPESEVVDFVDLVEPIIKEIAPSFFEITVAMAFWYFAKEDVDIAVIETGLGGRLDSTNIIIPALSVITHISFDHMEFLGDTLQEIAVEKAGIIKKMVPVVIGRDQAETRGVFVSKCQKTSSSLYFADRLMTLSAGERPGCYDIQDHALWSLSFCSDLLARYQKENIRTALAALTILANMDPRFKLSHEDVKFALGNVGGQTGLKGRWQRLHEEPLTIVDGGHNVEGIQTILEELKALDYNKLLMVVGFVKDKNLSDILDLLPKKAQYFLSAAQIPRALAVADLDEMMSVRGFRTTSFRSVQEAYQAAKQQAGPHDLVLVAGSMYVVAEVL